MSTHVPGFQFLKYFASFCVGLMSHQGQLKNVTKINHPDEKFTVFNLLISHALHIL